jgi:hypothetical protein
VAACAGPVRYSISAAPIVTCTCWCRVCQYIGAGSATVNTCFPSEALTVSGELRDFWATATIWTSSAPSWACFDERLAKVERQPPPAA